MITQKSTAGQKKHLIKFEVLLKKSPYKDLEKCAVLLGLIAGLVSTCKSGLKQVKLDPLSATLQGILFFCACWLINYLKFINLEIV